MSIERSAFGVERSRSRRGATLLVTLGVMTVLSIMVVTFLLTMRHQRLSAQHYRNKVVARQYLNTALSRAMEYADHAMLASNYISQASTPLPAEQQRLRRLYPLGKWYSSDYNPDEDARITDKVDFQNQEVLTVPVFEESGAAAFSTNALTVDLLTDEVRRLLPPAVTNNLAVNNGRLRSGWITDSSAGIRISFAVVNCSGLMDAHTFDFDTLTLSTATQSYDRAYFSEQDLLNDRSRRMTGQKEREILDHLATLSYDPGPQASPSARPGAAANSKLGYSSFTITNKFDLNSLTNYYDKDSTIGCERLLVTQPFLTEWLGIVSNAINAAQADQQQSVILGDAGKVAWNIAAYMTPSRVPQISYPGIALPTRTDYGVEAVPLVNEVAVFNCIEENGSFDGFFSTGIEKIKNETWPRMEQELKSLYGETATLDPITSVSNVYAAAAELWYPFAPRPVYDPNQDGTTMRVYLGVYTNKGDVLTTTNSPWTAGDLADWYESIAELQTYVMHDQYTDRPDEFTNSVFWILVRTNDLVTSNIINPGKLNETEHLNYSTALANAMVGELTDPATGMIATNNPFINLLTLIAPPPTDMPPDAVTNYYNMASNYIPVLVTVLTSRVDGVYGEIYTDLGSLTQRYLSASKIQIGPFGDMWTPCDEKGYLRRELRDEDFNEQGFFAVTNNIDLACFPILQEVDRENKRFSVGFLPLGDTRKLWVRPLVAVKEPGGYGLEENDGYEAVDEALLAKSSGGSGGDTQISVAEWPPKQTTAETGTSAERQRVWSLSVSDPRDNAWYESADIDDHKNWYVAVPSFGGVNTRTSDDLDSTSTLDEGAGYSDQVPGVAELPFIHADAPLRTIGELGHVTADLGAKAHNKARHALDRSGNPIVRDTIDFSTTAGAALLDRFTTASTNRPTRGLVQANAPYATVVEKLIQDVPLGWTNSLAPTEHLSALSKDQGLEDMTACWTNTLLKAFDNSWNRNLNGLPGWRCFAEMLPDLATNAERQVAEKLSALTTAPFYRHDYVEDALRELPERVSFRQNIYVVVVAAQTLSPASTTDHPVVLSDQRAAVTVLRDAFTGRWMIYNWTWLTE